MIQLTQWQLKTSYDSAHDSWRRIGRWPTVMAEYPRDMEAGIPAIWIEISQMKTFMFYPHLIHSWISTQVSLFHPSFPRSLHHEFDSRVPPSLHLFLGYASESRSCITTRQSTAILPSLMSEVVARVVRLFQSSSMINKSGRDCSYQLAGTASSTPWQIVDVQVCML